MNDPNKPKDEPHGDECCSELKCESGLRNNYFEGKRLTADSFRVEQEYALGRRRMLNRAIHGWGVVYGFGIDSHESHSGRLGIGPGLALDRCGRELLEGGRKIAFEEVFNLDRAGKRIDLDELRKQLGIPPGVPWDQVTDEIKERIGDACWLLSAHYAEKDTSHVRIEDRCCCGRDEWDHVCETVRYSLQQIDCDECCRGFDCELSCECRTGPCCDEAKEEPGEPGDCSRIPRDPTAEPVEQSGAAYQQSGRVVEARGEYPEQIPEKSPTTRSPQRGGCNCLCEHLTNLSVAGECDDLCTIKESCGSVRVDIKNGVRLACVKLVIAKCGLEFGEVSDACGPRRLVKRNDLLFDLIRGCDLTRIVDYGWKGWHRNDALVPYSNFRAAFGTGGKNDAEYITKCFWVEFSRGVRSDTVQPDCFVMTIINSETDDRWWETSRVPIVRVEKPPGDLITEATIVVNGKWLRGAVWSDSTRLQNGPFRVELEVRGDFIVDCNGQTVDANPHGRRDVPTGNGTPGGSFLSTFLVEAAPENSVDYEDEDRNIGVS